MPGEKLICVLIFRSMLIRERLENKTMVIIETKMMRRRPEKEGLSVSQLSLEG